MNWSYGNWDLTDCDREPIHQIGHIQPFGALVAVDSDWAVTNRSNNSSEVLGLARNPELGQPLAEHFSDAAIDRLKGALARTNDSTPVERIFGFRFEPDGTQFDVAVHRSGPVAIMEFEPHDDAEYANHVAMVAPLITQLEGVQGIDALCERAAQLIKELTGFDRVMAYRFHPDESGEVIAEVRKEGLEPYLGLRYPRTDIPQQARELFRRNRFRIISDTSDAPVAIDPPVSPDGEPLDLSMSVLRAQSEIHVEYLRNMGVAASLSIAVVVKNKLWGLFACHHYSPRHVPYSLRTVAEMFSQVFSLMIDRNSIDTNEQLRTRGRNLRDQLMVQLAGDARLAKSLPLIDEVLAEVIPHDGASLLADNVYSARGSAPLENEFRALLPALSDAPAGKVIATDCIAGQLKSAEAFSDRAAGALIIPLSRKQSDYLVLWRKELPQKVTWAGNPEEAMLKSPDGARLTPRKSFEAWSEELSGRSQQWSEEEIETAESLRVSMIEVILRLTDEALNVRSRAQEQQELLIAELNHRVRNILNLIRSLVSQSKRDAQTIGDYSEIIGGRIAALASAHDHITEQNWSPAPFSALIEAEVEAYLQEKRDRLTLKGDDVLIAPEAYTVLALVMHEMVTNSAKYGSLTDARGDLEIGLHRDDDGDLHIAWRERGGPSVEKPERRGFGSTIIERSIPFELKGKTEVRFEPGGLEADFVVPGRYVSELPTSPEHGSGDTGIGAKTSGSMDSAMAKPPETVLLVEDNMIIAMDTEESLRHLGVKHVETTGSVSGSLSALDELEPDLAIVDFNLGDETSEPVIEVLKERGIPYILATGYGEATVDGQHKHALGMLTKPYGKNEISGMLARLTQPGSGRADQAAN